VRAPADFLCDHVQRPKEIAKEQSAALAFILKKCASSHNEGQPDIEYEQPNSKDRNWQKLLHPYGVTHPTGYRSDRPHLDRPLKSRRSSLVFTTIAVLDTRRMRFEHEAAPVRVHERMALTAVDLLSRIVTARPAGLGGLGALAVDDCRRGAGVAPDPFAICHHERVV
jgi:hypothetical protein